MKIDLGAPSLSGKDANDAVEQAFGKLAFPCDFLVKNLMPRDVVFPEVDGLFLKHCADLSGGQKQVTILSYELLQRLASSIEQIAELNGYAQALSLEIVENNKTAATPANPNIPADKNKAKAEKHDKPTDKTEKGG